jgi:hypothetical protein
MKKVFFFFFLLFAVTVKAQEEAAIKQFDKREISFLIFPYTNKDFYTSNRYYSEFLTSLKFTTNLSKFDYLGIEYYKVWLKSVFSTTSKFFFDDFFIANILYRRTGKISVIEPYGEIKMGYGDFCDCFGVKRPNLGETPYRLNPIFFTGVSVGLNYQLNDFLAIDISFNAYINLNKLDNKRDYFRPLVGLKYIYDKGKRKLPPIIYSPRF